MLRARAENLNERAPRLCLGQGVPMTELVTLRTVHGWRRFWCLREESYSLGDAGFLIDPETEYGRHLQPNAIALNRLDEAPCLVLLGEPGIGKSTSVEQD